MSWRMIWCTFSGRPTVRRMAEPSSEGEDVKRGKGQSSKRKRTFTKELKYMLYGFGDVSCPASDTVEVMEDMVLEFITETALRAERVASKRGKIKTEDFLFVVRKDPKKYARVEQLLLMNDELKRARRAFEVDEVPLEEEDLREDD